KLHNSVYVVALLVPLHFIWSVKSEIIEPSIYIALTVLLLWARKDQLKRIFSR
ncbi:MAG: sulfoxide reductase heme-binding subunit YedZ, partial [Psychrobium sp.]